MMSLIGSFSFLVRRHLNPINLRNLVPGAVPIPSDELSLADTRCLFCWHYPMKGRSSPRKFAVKSDFLDLYILMSFCPQLKPIEKANLSSHFPQYEHPSTAVIFALYNKALKLFKSGRTDVKRSFTAETAAIALRFSVHIFVSWCLIFKELSK